MKLGVAGRLTFLDTADSELGVAQRLQPWHREPRRRRVLSTAERVTILRIAGCLHLPALAGFEHGDSAQYAFKVRETGASFDLSYATGRLSELRIGYRVSKLHTYVTSGTPSLPPLSGMVGATRMQFTHDGMNHIVPTEGVYFSFDGQWVNRRPGARKAFPMMESGNAYARQLTKSYSVLETMSGGTTVNTV